MRTITFFKTPGELRRWLQSNHDTATELWVGIYKKTSGVPGISYQQALDEALCMGWIDGVRKNVDARSYTIRFSPRKPRSIWSAINIRRVAELVELGRMKKPGLDVFHGRDLRKAGQYSFENRPQELDAAYRKIFQARKAAWDFFRAQPPGYRRTATWWVVSAKREETRLRRLTTLIEDSARGSRIGLLSSPARKRR